MSGKLAMYTVDAFTGQLFGGNPAAVCLVDHQYRLSEEEMQKIAAEMNLSETAFVSHMNKQSSFNSDRRFALRWFTPKCEVALCGHGTLSAAAVLFNCLGNRQDSLEFETLSGMLSARRLTDGYISIYLPENKPVHVDANRFQEVIDVVCGAVRPVDVSYSETTKKLVLRLPDTYTRSELETLRFNINSLLAVEASGRVKGVIVTVLGSTVNGAVDEQGEVYDFISRYFAPWVGINEDPVTGSAHTVLASYWSTLLNKTSFYARQCSPRGGDLKLCLLEVGERRRVEISGQSTFFLTGTISVH